MVIEIRDFLAEYPHQTPVSERQGLAEAIAEVKQRRRAVILAHNYQLPEVQEIADFVGDSLELSRKAAATEAEVIVFCGVHFMAQTAKLLSPQRPVLLPDLEAGCPMADMIDVEGVLALREQYPGCPVVAYVNTTAEVKAHSDICCTSANSVKVVESLEADEILFIPDRYLAHWTQRQTSKRIIAYQGFCPTHALMTAEMIRQARQEHPEAVVMCHPECPPEVCDEADVVASTSGMIRAAAERPEKEFVVATEWGLAARTAREHPDKLFFIFPEAVCPNMKKITLSKVLASLRDMSGAIELEEDVISAARQSVERMLALP
ncbi:MAG: quinolinate synthase NadA [Armatimonadetes bacterium]|nr:quinolinate synthase NadA [Armatimonadota bacterium]